MKPETPPEDSHSISPAPGYLRFFPLWPGQTREDIESEVNEYLDTVDFATRRVNTHPGEIGGSTEGDLKKPRDETSLGLLPRKSAAAAEAP